MKTMKFFCIVLMSILVFSGCQKDELLQQDLKNKINQQDEKPLGYENGNVALPFKARFFTRRNYSNTGVGYCDAFAGTPAFNYQYGENCGTATHMGKIKIAEMYFCNGAPGPSGIPYTNGEGTLTAANGDAIYIEVPADSELGYVVLLDPGSHPIYDAYFRTPFKIVGGTGRFLNASGEGKTNSYVDLLDENGVIPEHQTDHEWIGTIRIPK